MLTRSGNRDALSRDCASVHTLKSRALPLEFTKSRRATHVRAVFQIALFILQFTCRTLTEAIQRNAPFVRANYTGPGPRCMRS